MLSYMRAEALCLESICNRIAMREGNGRSWFSRCVPYEPDPKTRTPPRWLIMARRPSESPSKPDASEHVLEMRMVKFQILSRNCAIGPRQKSLLLRSTRKG